MFLKIKSLLFILVIAGSAAFAADPQAIRDGDKQLSIVMVEVCEKGGSSEDLVFHGSRSALKEQKMKVLFKGRPLAGAEVTVFTKSGWQKSLPTDAAGEVTIIPIVTSSKNANETYSVTYTDPASGVGYVSNNSLLFAKPPPEWMKKADGFMLWALAGSGLVVAGIGMTIYRVMQLEKRGMLAFEKYKVGKI